jgi:hypothetical protein
MMVHEFLEHRTAPARPGNSNRSWNIADSPRWPLSDSRHRGENLHTLFNCGEHEKMSTLMAPVAGHVRMTACDSGSISTHVRPVVGSARPRSSVFSADARVQARSCIVDLSSRTEPASVRAVPFSSLRARADRPNFGLVSSGASVAIHTDLTVGPTKVERMMFRSMKRRITIGGWFTLLVAAAGIGLLSGSPIGIRSVAFWFLICSVPSAVMLMVWGGAPPLTVAEVIYAAEQKA